MKRSPNLSQVYSLFFGKLLGLVGAFHFVGAVGYKDVIWLLLRAELVFHKKDA